MLSLKTKNEQQQQKSHAFLPYILSVSQGYKGTNQILLGSNTGKRKRMKGSLLEWHQKIFGLVNEQEKHRVIDARAYLRS